MMSAGVVLVLAAQTFAGCATAPREAPPAFSGGAPGAQAPLSLTPVLSLTGARVASAVDRTGTPSPAAGAMGFTRLIRPLALAARAGDVVILDSGAGTAYRYDTALNAMSVLRGVPVHPGTQLALGADYSLYVIDQTGRRVMRMARNGQVVAYYGDSANLQRPVDVAVDDARGLVIVADGGYNQLMLFHPLGGGARVMSVRGSAGTGLQSVSHVAAGPDAIYVTDPLCRCIGRIDYNGGVLGIFGQDVLSQPGALAVDRLRRVFVIDQFERVLKVFQQGKWIDTLAARRLGVEQIDDVWVDDNLLYVADGLAGRVEVLRVAAQKGP